MRLSNRVALVTGGASGIGKGIASRFVQEGASVTIVDWDDEAGNQTSDELGARFFRADVSVAEQTAEVVEAVGREFGRIDILVNNAAIYSADTGEHSCSDWEKILKINLTAYKDYALAVLELMRHSEAGSIVNVGSVHRLISDDQSTAYAVAKAGVHQLTRSLALRLAPLNILVNSVSPGFIRTPMGIEDGIDVTATPEFETQYLSTGRIPLRRVGFPDEIAVAIAFLASAECRYLTGADLVADGGLSLTL